MIKTVASSPRTDTRHTHVTRTDKSLKTEGPKILSNDIFYFRTVIIGGPITNNNISFILCSAFEINLHVLSDNGMLISKFERLHRVVHELRVLF